MIFAAVLLLGAVILIAAGIYRNSRGGMNGFALIVFGGFATLAAVVTASVYASMQRRFRQALGEPLLTFISAEQDHDRAVAKTISQIKGTNLITLVTILIFCIVLAIIGPFLADDGYLFSLIALGIAIFASLTAFIVTGYRISKLRRGSREVVLSRNGVYVAGEFHSWSGFSSQLIDIKFIAPEKEDEPALISGAYKMLGAYRSNVGYFNLIVPVDKHNQAREAVQLIMETNRGRRRG